jgi:hypothetical protein
LEETVDHSMLDQPHELNTPAVISDDVGGETLAINLTTGAYYVIPPAASGLWSGISTGVPARAYLAEGDPREQALGKFVGTLVDAGLLRPAQSASAGDPVDGWEAADLMLEEHTDMADLLGLDPIHDVDEAVGWPAARTDG